MTRVSGSGGAARKGGFSGDDAIHEARPAVISLTARLHVSIPQRFSMTQSNIRRLGFPTLRHARSGLHASPKPGGTVSAEP